MLIHQAGNVLQFLAIDAPITRHIAYPFFVNLLSPVRPDHAGGCQPHEQVALGSGVQNTGIQHDYRD